MYKYIDVQIYRCNSFSRNSFSLAAAPFPTALLLPRPLTVTRALRRQNMNQVMLAAARAPGAEEGGMGELALTQREDPAESTVHRGH